MYFPSVPPVDEVALAGGDVPLADGGVRRPRVHVDVMQRRARYVLRVAPKRETVLDVAIKLIARLRDSNFSAAVELSEEHVSVCIISFPTRFVLLCIRNWLGGMYK